MKIILFMIMSWHTLFAQMAYSEEVHAKDITVHKKSTTENMSPTSWQRDLLSQEKDLDAYYKRIEEDYIRTKQGEYRYLAYLMFFSILILSLMAWIINKALKNSAKATERITTTFNKMNQKVKEKKVNGIKMDESIRESVRDNNNNSTLNSITEELQQLSEMKEKGLLSEEEFKKAKMKIIESDN